MELLIGLIGALVGIGLFIAGFFIGKSQVPAWTPKEVEMTPEEIENIRKERERLIADQQAFRTLMNYGTDQAYGLGSSK